jgi:hypothetical protein
VIAAAIFCVILIDDGCLLLLIILLVGSAIVSGITWVGVHSFPGTTVSTPPAQVIYGIGVALWGLALWYVFLADATRAVIDASSND